MFNIRIGAFETNSSNYHSFVIHIGNYDQISIDCEYEREDVWLEPEDIDDILDNLPIERLENALKRRQEWSKTEQIKE